MANKQHLKTLIKYHRMITKGAGLVQRYLDAETDLSEANLGGGLISKGGEGWNKWRQQHPKIQPDLSEAELSLAQLSNFDLSGANLRGSLLIGTNLWSANLSGADLSEAKIRQSELGGANLTGANLSYAELIEANLLATNLSRANLKGADLSYTYLKETNLSDADLSHADLNYAVLIETNLERANLNGCYIYGIAAWNVQLEGASQNNLVITPYNEPTITVDNLKVAQFIYLLLNNEEIRDVINTITSKVVLILGRFTDERKRVLDALRDELRKYDYLPVLFDFEKPASRDLTETISTLAHMARFIIADITDPRSIPQELAFIVPALPSVPVQPIIHYSQSEYGMFEHFTRYPWVLPLYRYTDQESLLQSLKEKVIDPAEKKAQELAKQ